jgi:hypothetical protein
MAIKKTVETKKSESESAVSTAVKKKTVRVKKPTSAAKSVRAKKPAAAKAAPAKQPGTKKAVVAKKPMASVASASPAHAPLSQEERSHRIAVAAYLRAEARGFAQGGEVEDWLCAEREVGAQLGLQAP